MRLDDIEITDDDLFDIFEASTLTVSEAREWIREALHLNPAGMSTYRLTEYLHRYYDGGLICFLAATASLRTN